MNNETLLNILCDYCWLHQNKRIAANIMEQYQGELSELNYQMLEEVIFGMMEIEDEYKQTNFESDG